MNGAGGRLRHSGGRLRFGGAPRKYGGTGLGPTISRPLCRLPGYRIQVRSEVGRGSTFSILMPA